MHFGRLRRFLFGILLLTGATRAAADAEPLKISPGFYDSTLRVGDLTRHYRVYVPRKKPDGGKLPLILVLHGGGGNRVAADAASDFRSRADSEGILLALPEGTGKDVAGKHFGTWNAGECCGAAKENQVDDVSFLRALIDRLLKDFPVDAARVFVTGISNGGMMAYRLACELPDKIAAIAPVAAVGMFTRCEPGRAVPTLHIQGKKDPCVPYGGGSGGGCFERFVGKMVGKKIPETRWASPPVENFVGEWRKRSGATGAGRITYQNGQAMCESFGGPGQPDQVVFCTIADGGHTWPGGNYGPVCRISFSRACRLYREQVGNLSRDLSATSIIWDFFRQHPLTIGQK